MTQDSMMTILNELKDILLEEKDVLIQQDGSKIQDILARKEAIVEKMEQAEVNDMEKVAIHTLAKEVKDLQETNEMLTKQAMNYNEVFLTALQKEAKKNNTYSNKGEVKKANRSGILDQSL